MINQSIIVLMLFMFIGFCNGQKSNVQQWTKDIEFYHSTLEERHIDLYHSISKEDFTERINELKSKLPELTKFQVIVELMRLTHEIGGGITDGHTSVPLWGLELHRYPISFFNFDGDLRVVKAPSSKAKLLGKKLKSIDGVEIEEIYEEVSKLTPFTENKQSTMHRTTSYLLIGELLNALNITEDINKGTFVFTDDEGSEFTFSMEALTNEASDGIKYEEITISHPKIKKPDTTKLSGLWFTGLKENSTVYIKFHRYPSNPEQIEEFGDVVLDFINRNNSKNLIIDLRGNYGGDFYLGLLLPWSLNLADSIDWKNSVYVLTDRVTFSAAAVNAAQFRQLLNAKIVGEPTGGNPNGYQDMGQFKLPYSGLLITYTKRLFRLQEKSTLGVQPDLLIAPEWKDFKNGRDVVLEQVLENIME
jgi:hypothetical protein